MISSQYIYFVFLHKLTKLKLRVIYLTIPHLNHPFFKNDYTQHVKNFKNPNIIKSSNVYSAYEECLYCR